MNPDNDQRWREATPGSGVIYRAYQAFKFGPANAVAVSISETDCAVVSPPPRPSADDFIQVDALGRVSAIVIPNYGHMSGLEAWTVRYPDARVYAPINASTLAEKAGKGSFLPLSDLTTDAAVVFSDVPGARTGGTILSVERGERRVIYADEMLITMPQRPGNFLYKLLFRALRVRPGLAINKVYLNLMVEDRQAAARAMLAALANDPVCLVAHGPPIVEPAELLQARQIFEEFLS